MILLAILVYGRLILCFYRRFSLILCFYLFVYGRLLLFFFLSLNGFLV
jgi:hypothetical protein